MLLNVAAHNISIQNVKVSKCECRITYSVIKRTASQNVKCALRKRFVTVYVLWHCTLCDIYIFKTLRFGTLTLCAATLYKIMSCYVLRYVALRYVATSLRGRSPRCPWGSCARSPGWSCPADERNFRLQYKKIGLGIKEYLLLFKI